MKKSLIKHFLIDHLGPLLGKRGAARQTKPIWYTGSRSLAVWTIPTVDNHILAIEIVLEWNSEKESRALLLPCVTRSLPDFFRPDLDPNEGPKDFGGSLYSNYLRNPRFAKLVGQRLYDVIGPWNMNEPPRNNDELRTIFHLFAEELLPIIVSVTYAESGEAR